jgi:signal transduction histidine kinase
MSMCRLLTAVAWLTAVARAALHDVQNIAAGDHRVSLATEAEGAASLLAAAGIEAHLDMAVADATPSVDELLGWTLREGVTNVLRHSAATTCSISLRRDRGRVRMEIENDGAAATSTGGSGLVGLAARAAALSGSATGAEAGLPTDDIAERLHLSPTTVRNYLSNAIAKVGARNRLDAIRIARNAGWV